VVSVDSSRGFAFGGKADHRCTSVAFSRPFRAASLDRGSAGNVAPIQSGLVPPTFPEPPDSEAVGGVAER